MTAGNKPSHIDDAEGINFSIMIDKNGYGNILSIILGHSSYVLIHDAIDRAHQ